MIPDYEKKYREDWPDMRSSSLNAVQLLRCLGYLKRELSGRSQKEVLSQNAPSKSVL